MPRKHHRRHGIRQSQRLAPSLRIARSRAAVDDEAPIQAELPSPLDAVKTVQPTDLVPHATTLRQIELPSILVDDDYLDGTSEPTLEEYVRRIEASAARLRAEQTGDALGAGAALRPARLAAEEEPVQRVPGRRSRTARRPRAEETKPWYRRKRTWLIVGMVVPLLFVATATAYVLNIVRVSVDAYGEIHEDPVDRERWRVNPQGTPEPVPSAEVESVMPNWENDEPVNIVLMGVDARVGDDLPPRSDTTIIVHINPATNEVAMMSIPRDLLVFIPGFGEDKFNAAYPLGEANADEIEGGGTTLVASTIEANFNIPIHYYATIDFTGFEQVVDTVGGIIIDVPNQLTDNLYPTDDLRVTRIYFPSGLQAMDGEEALQYVRTRHADSDFGRAERQQQVLLAIREQAISRDLITQAQPLIRDLQDTVRTDLNFNQMLALSNLGRQVAQDDIARLNLWDEGLLFEHMPEFEGDAYYLSADWGAVLAETEAFFGSGTLPAEDTADNPGEADEGDFDLGVSVFVENATDIPLLAGNSAQILVDAGFLEVWPSDARANQAASTIETPESQIATARHIADLLGLPGTAIVTGGSSDGITVILGEDVPDALVPDPEQVAG